MVRNGSLRTRLRACLEMLKIESPCARLKARMTMLRTKSPRARLKAHLEVLGTESPRARLKAHLEVLGIESPRVDHYCLIVRGVALADPGGADALAAMRSYFNVDSIVTTRRLVEMRKNYFVPPEYELHAPLPGEHPYDSFSSGFSLSTDALEADFEWEVRLPATKVGSHAFSSSLVVGAGASQSSGHLGRSCWFHSREAPSIDEELSLRKCNKRVTLEQLADTSGSTTRVPTEKGKELVEIEEALKRGWLVQTQHERVLVLQAANKELKLGANQDLVVAIEFHAKGLEEDVKKLRAELESLKNQRRGLEGEVEVLCSSLDRARDDRARLEGDVLSLTEATSLLEVELKAEEPKAVAAYKASRRFVSGLEKMG
ncbi:hypothetical protein BHM03_00052298 [Ensete ventricosum]|nr:hypothetical protein BHM03_00052298 [Ensete ventricosum]